LGIFLRLRQYAFRRSLWNDEAALAINIINRSYGGLTRKLAVEQGAPIGFLWLEKTSTELFGHSEYALRLVPLLAGIASVIVFRTFTRRVLPPLAANVALGLFAVAPALVYYASESKQYGFDVFAVVALAAFFPWLIGSDLSWRHAVWWGGTAAVLVWCSFPAVYLAGSVSLAVVLVAGRRRQWVACARFIAGCAIWVVALGAEYIVSLRSLHSDPKLLGYWADAFPPRPLHFSSTQKWIRADLHVIVAYPWHFQIYPLTVAALLFGLAMLLWRRRSVGVFLGVLAVAVVSGAIAHEYPMADRMVLFTIPFVCVLLGALLLVSPRLPLQLLMMVPVLVVSASEISTSASAVVHPYTKTEVREAYVYVLQHERPGDAVFVEWEGLPDFLYYHQTLGVAAEGSFQLSGSQSACDNRAQLAQLQTWKRVWLVFGIDPDTEAGNPIGHYESVFRHVARISSTFSSPGPSGAVLLTMDQGPLPASLDLPAPPWAPSPYGCILVSVGPLASLLTTINSP
jgi:hypothetical protein